MASEKHMIQQYQSRRDAAFDAFESTPAPAKPSADNPMPTAGAAKLGPPSPSAPGVWQRFWATAKAVTGAGATAGWDTFKSGVHNVGKGAANTLVPPTPAKTVGEDLAQQGRGLGQALFGYMELASVLPAGAAAAVREAAKVYVPGMEAAVVPGLSGGPNSWAGYLRTMLMSPQLLLDPRMQAADPQDLLGSLDEPMTFELGA